MPEKRKTTVEPGETRLVGGLFDYMNEIFTKLVNDLDDEVKKNTNRLSLEYSSGARLGISLAYEGTTVSDLPVQILVNGWVSNLTRQLCFN